jgi:hypothetical protein
MEEKKEIITGSPVTVAGLTLIPIMETRLYHWRYHNSFALFGSKQAIGMIVVTPTLTKALKVNGEEVTLEELKREFPDLETKMDKH